MTNAGAPGDGQCIAVGDRVYTKRRGEGTVSAAPADPLGIFTVQFDSGYVGKIPGFHLMIPKRAEPNVSNSDMEWETRMEALREAHAADTRDDLLYSVGALAAERDKARAELERTQQNAMRQLDRWMSAAESEHLRAAALEAENAALRKVAGAVVTLYDAGTICPWAEFTQDLCGGGYAGRHFPVTPERPAGIWVHGAGCPTQDALRLIRPETPKTEPAP